MPESLTTRNVTEVLKSFVEKVSLDLGVSESTLERSFDPLFTNLSGISAGGANLQDVFTNVQVAELSNAVTYLEQLIKETIGDSIVEGFFVRPTDPPSNKVRVYPGICYVNGKRIQIPETITFTVDLEDGPETHFVYMKPDGVLGVNPYLPDDSLALAKIEKPSPYSKVIIEDRDFSSTDAYIVSGRDILFDNNAEFDDESFAALRNITQEILAQNLIGTIVINENLRIQNTQGSLDMDSKEIRIKDPSGNVLSKLNSNGVFFYSSTGEEFSHFGRNNARVGNIKITPNSLESVNFLAGESGFKIASGGSAEFSDVIVRGVIEAETGYIGGENGWIIETAKITGGDIELDASGIIRIGTGNNIAILDSTNPTYRFWIGNQNPLFSTFSVTKEGALKSTSGEIGGYSISDTTLSTTNVVISSVSGGQISVGNILLTGSTSTIQMGTGIAMSGLVSGTIDVGTDIHISGAGGGSITVGPGPGVILDGASGSITATVGSIAGFSLANSKFFAPNLEIISSSGGSIQVGDILLTGSNSTISAGNITLDGSGDGSLTIGGGITMDGATQTITLSTGGSFVAGDTTLNSQGLTISGTYSSVSIGTGNDIIKINNTDGIYLGNVVKASAPFSVNMQGYLKSVSGEIANWFITQDKIFSTHVDIISSGGGSFRVGSITLTGVNSTIAVGTSIDIVGVGSGSISVGTGIDIDGATQQITLSNSGAFVAGDSTLNSQGLTINGTYSSISLGTGNNIIKINNSDGIYLGHANKASAPFSVSMQGELHSTFGDIAQWIISSSTLSSPGNAIILDAANKRIDVGGTIRLDGLNQRAESTNFQSGINGWRLDGQGNAEFQNCIVRGQLHTSVFVKDEIHATNGQMLVTDAANLTTPINSTATKIYISDGVFFTGDRLRMKTASKTEMFKVIGTGSDGGGDFINVTRNFDGLGAYSWDVGLAIVSVESRVSLVASGFPNLPYIDIIERTGDLTEVSRARLGNLNGISGATGFGLWSENVFLTGKITALSGSIANWEIFGNELRSFNNKIILDSQNEKITASNIIIDGINDRIDVGSFIDIVGTAGGQIIVGSINDVYLDGATGKIVAKKGEVGGWILSANSLASDSGSPPIISILSGASAVIKITDGSTEHVALGKYDGSNYGLKSGDATLNSSGLTISGTTSSISLGTGNNIIKMNNANGLYLGNALQANAPFSVTMAGFLKASSGDIAGWQFDSTKLYSANVELNSSSGGSITVGNIILTGSTSRIDVGSAVDIIGTGSGKIQIGAGITMDGSTQRVTLSGSGQFIAGDATLSSSSLTINGTASSISIGTSNSVIKINNTDGLYLGNAIQSLAPFSVTMAGVLKATSGTIGGYSINASQIFSSNITLDNSGVITIGTGNDLIKLSSSDPNYRLWAGHSSSGSAPFKIHKDGSIFATNADIQGTIKAIDGYIGTLTNGWNINANKITAFGTGLIETASGATSGIKLDGSSLRGYDGSSQRFKLGTDGSGFLGSSSVFTWNTSGGLTLGGFSVGSSSLTAGSGSNSVGVSASGTHAFYAGNTVPGSAPFRVNFAGQLNAVNAIISGDITCNVLNASTSGNVAGWDISASHLTSSGGAIRTSSSATVNGITLDNTGLRGYGNGTQKFALTASDGRLFANEADIGRKITKITTFTNVGSAINAAISQFGADGGIIYIPSGTYRLDVTINMADNITIKGSGPDQTRLVPNVALGTMIDISWNVDNVEILDLEMDADYTIYGGSTASKCINISGSGGIENLRLKNCVFRDASSVNVDFSYAGREQIEGCVFYVASGAIGVDGATNITNCEFNGGGTGITSGGVVSNCEFNGLSLGVNYALQLVDNRFFNCGTCYLQQYYSEGNIIRGNLFRDYSSRGISFTSRNFLFTITDNVFESGSGIAIELGAVFSGIVSNNNFYEHSGSYIIRADYLSTEYLSHAPSLNITGNMVYRCSVSSGFFDINLTHHIDSRNSLLISNNTIKSCTVTGNYGRGIKVYDPNAMISNNLITEVIITSSSASFYFIDCYQMANVSGNTLAHIILPGGGSNFITGITFNWVDSVFNGNLIWFEANSTSTIRGFYKQGGAERTMYNNNSIYVKNTGTGNGEAFNVSITEGVAVGNNYNGSDSLGTLSISSGVVANNNG